MRPSCSLRDEENIRVARVADRALDSHRHEVEGRFRHCPLSLTPGLVYRLAIRKRGLPQGFLSNFIRCCKNVPSVRNLGPTTPVVFKVCTRGLAALLDSSHILSINNPYYGAHTRNQRFYALFSISGILLLATTSDIITKSDCVHLVEFIARPNTPAVLMQSTSGRYRFRAPHHAMLGANFYWRGEE